MSAGQLQTAILSSWFVVVATLVAVRLAMGIVPSLAEGVVALLLACAPAVVFKMVFRGPPPDAIGKVLYDAEHATAPGRRPSTNRRDDA